MAKLDFVAIINLTPDSFSGDGLTNVDKAIKQAERLLSNGVSIVDLGAESTRPGAIAISAKEEWIRLKPVFSNLIKKHPNRISIDSYHPETYKKALRISNKFIVNDVTGLNNEELKKLVIDNKLRVIISHFPKSLNQDIQAGHQPENKIDSFDQVKKELLEKRQQLIDNGLDPNLIILDPGIGFGKTPELNKKLLKFAEAVPGINVLIGYSKKSFMGEERMSIFKNIESGKKAKQSGARYLRLHQDLIDSHKQLL
ncbi:MAG: dihydropteroate synthase [Candidatus Saccharimonadales bacterium]